MRPKVALSAPEPGLAVGQVDCVVAALLEKRSALAADLAVAEDTVTCLRRQITALSETLKTFGHLEPKRDRMPAAVLLNLKQCCADVRAFEIRIHASSIEKQLVLDAFMQI